uniref:Organ specific protein n=1 Tax=Lotus japonicus TaxID=34305 RepID=I3T4P8_LOTJA|nr:unknown [Lotus japonicus]
MRSVLALLPLLFLFLFASTVESRKDQGEYWKMIMKDEEMPEGIQGLLQLKSEIKPGKNSEHKCDEEHVVTNNEYIIEKKVFTEELEPRSNISAYDDDHVDTKGNKKYMEDLEPRPNLSAYDDDHVDKKGNKKYLEDLEPRPNLSAYDDDHIDTKGDKKYMERIWNLGQTFQLITTK